MKKRLLALFMIAGLVITLTACGQGNDIPQSSSNSVEEEAQEADENPLVDVSDLSAFVGNWTSMAMFYNEKPATRWDIYENRPDTIDNQSFVGGYAMPTRLLIFEDQTFIYMDGLDEFSNSFTIEDGVLVEKDNGNGVMMQATLDPNGYILYSSTAYNDGYIHHMFIKDTNFFDPSTQLTGKWICTMSGVNKEVNPLLTKDTPYQQDMMLIGSELEFLPNERATLTLYDGTEISANVTVDEDKLVWLITDNGVTLPLYPGADAQGNLTGLKMIPVIDDNGNCFSCQFEQELETPIPFSEDILLGSWTDTVMFDGLYTVPSGLLAKFETHVFGSINEDDWWDEIRFNDDQTVDYLKDGKVLHTFDYTIDGPLISIDCQDHEDEAALIIYIEKTGKIYAYHTSPYNCVLVMQKQ